MESTDNDARLEMWPVIAPAVGKGETGENENARNSEVVQLRTVVKRADHGQQACAREAENATGEGYLSGNDEGSNGAPEVARRHPAGQHGTGLELLESLGRGRGGRRSVIIALAGQVDLGGSGGGAGVGQRAARHREWQGQRGPRQGERGSGATEARKRSAEGRREEPPGRGLRHRRGHGHGKCCQTLGPDRGRERRARRSSLGQQTTNTAPQLRPEHGDAPPISPPPGHGNTCAQRARTTTLEHSFALSTLLRTWSYTNLAWLLQLDVPWPNFTVIISAPEENHHIMSSFHKIQTRISFNVTRSSNAPILKCKNRL